MVRLCVIGDSPEVHRCAVALGQGVPVETDASARDLKPAVTVLTQSVFNRCIAIQNCGVKPRVLLNCYRTVTSIGGCNH